MATTVAVPRDTNPLVKSQGEVVLKFGVVGYGYWGPNVVRNLERLDET